MTEPHADTGVEAPRAARGRDNALVVYRALRTAILQGEYAAGDVVSQVMLAEEFGVSRGPVREALRLLQQEGLIDAEVNHRARVAALLPADLEAIYAQRIAIESLAIAASVPRFDDEDLDRAQALLEEMDRWTGVDQAPWAAAHAGFHRLLVAHAGVPIRETIDDLFEHSERYRRIYLAEGPRVWTTGIAEHREILEACVARDATLASSRLATHLSRTALSVLLMIAPEHDPALIRIAVRQVLGNGQAEPEPASSPRRRRPADAPPPLS